MTTIGSFFSGRNQLLSSQSSEQDKAAAATGQKVTTTTTPATTETATATNGAYSLNLSKEAKAYLAALEQKQAQSDTGFTLNVQQVARIKEILAPYAGLPVTQENFNRIQDELRNAGLAPEQMAVRQQASSFNSTSLFLDALSGKDIMTKSSDSLMATYQDKTTKYIGQVEKMWRALSEEQVAATSAN